MAREPEDSSEGSQVEQRYRALALEWIRAVQRLAGDAEGEPVRQRSAEALRLRVRGHSMAPLLRSGDVVWVEPVAPSALRRGDLVVVQRQGAWITHRLIARRGDRWYTKGDGLCHPDPAVPGEAILGRVIAIERDGSRIELRQRRWRVIHRILGWWGWLQAQGFAAAQRVQHRLFGEKVPSTLRALSRRVAAPLRWFMRLVLEKLSERMWR